MTGMCRSAKVTAVDEDEFRNDAHVADLAGPEKRATRQHESARITVGCARIQRRRFLRWLPVTGDMHNAPIALQQRVDDGTRISAVGIVFRANQGAHPVGIHDIVFRQRFRDSECFRARARQRWILRIVNLRLTDHQYMRFR